MKYKELQKGLFVKRPNRFTAHINIEGKEELCHVKNTGRLGELLLPGAEVLVEAADNPKRKTNYSLIAVKEGESWVNIDSQVPNKAAEEWIRAGGWMSDVISVTREKTYGNSRFDLYVETKEDDWFIEVKGVTLNVGGTALFPDAPTERGKKHVEELITCVKNGYKAAVLFVIQRKGVERFAPFEKRQPEFAEALRRAKTEGVEILAVDCLVDREGIRVDKEIPVCLFHCDKKEK
ncbi:MAG: DNA/RNA nuclease SfsA [Eubacteriales bacterium]|nr:DNA/RNA nuclease SfsA [Eubacteriales bacterium]